MKLRIAFLIIYLQSFFAVVWAQEYFQQELNYKIDVKLNDKQHSLKAYMELEYINNSPDDLNEIYFHLWPNAYKNNSTALAKQLLDNNESKFYYAPDSIKGYMDSLDFRVGGKVCQVIYDQKHIDIAKLVLNEALKPGQKITITTPFYVKIPLGIFSRLGYLGESYQITQWYPKPAVYDRNGWHAMPYLDQGEFYSEYGTYDVRITLPTNYVVGATGDLVDGQQELDWLNEKAAKTKQIETFSKDDSFPKSDSTYKTLHYRQSKVHDFAWFADKRWHVLKGEVELPHSKRKVTTWTMFTNAEADLWKKSQQYIQDAVYYYSLWNGDYPYNQVTAVDGALSAGGGMEYPNVTVIGSSGSDFGLETVIMHEVGHNWFYGILGSNERDYPWMDEGINSFYESRYIKTKYPDAGVFGIPRKDFIYKAFHLDHLSHQSEYELMYLLSARKNMDQPISMRSDSFSYYNYGGIVYSKSAVVFKYLQAYLGVKTFDKAMQTYFNTWKFKHPSPDDLRKILEEVSLKDLSWFFDDLIKTNKKLDYKVQSLTKQDQAYMLRIANKGDIAGPVCISIFRADSIVDTQWVEGFKGVQEIKLTQEQIDAVKIDAKEYMSEINRFNNNYQAKGLVKGMEPMKFQFLAGVENPNLSQVFYSPFLGWNNYNKLMPGLAFYNLMVPHKKIEYVLAPMYSFSTQEPCGYGMLAYNFFPKNNFRQIRLSANVQQFAFSNHLFDQQYSKLAPAINFYIKNPDARSKFNSVITLRSVMINKDRVIPTFDDQQKFKQYSLTKENYYVNEFAISLEEKRLINPYGIRALLEQGKGFIKASVEGTYNFTYRKGKKAVEIRVFGGRFISNNAADNRFNFSLNGNNDYTYDYYYLGRTDNTGLASRQVVVREGGFKNMAAIASSDLWLSSLNVKIPISKLPLSLYADYGLSGNTKSFYVSQSKVNSAWNTGIALVVIPNAVEIYFPVAMSSKLNQLRYGEKIRFILNINNLNPFKALRNLDFIGL